MNAHTFQATAGSKSPCSVCGKTRNAKAHKDTAPLEVVTLDGQDATVEVEATTVAEARAEMLPEASDAADDAEIADAMEAAGIKVADDEVTRDEQDAAYAEHVAAKEAEAMATPAKKATPAEAPTASIWVGWRITNAAVLDKTTVAAKLKAAKPTGDLDRTVKLTAEELQVLDAVAAKFMEPGHTGPEIYSGRALRGRIAQALAKIEGQA